MSDPKSRLNRDKKKGAKSNLAAAFDAGEEMSEITKSKIKNQKSKLD